MLNDPNHETPPERLLQLMESDSPLSDSFGICGIYPSKINWVQSDKQIIKEFSSWLKFTRPKGAKPEVVKGRKAQPADRFHLKWLAAHRLAASGLNFEVAKQHIKKRVGTKLQDPNDVLPNFSHATGWHAAIKKANKRLQRISAKRL